MDPKDYTGREWTDLMRELSPKPLKNALKGAYRAEAKKVQGIAVRYLNSSGLGVQGNKADWPKGIRSYVYSKGGGFLVTVKARKGKGGKDKGMHTNRYGSRKPVLMWAEDGTVERKTKSNRGRHTVMFIRRKRKGHSTGRMRAYGFLGKAEPEMYRAVETDLSKELESAVVKQARKCGFI